MPTIGPHRPDFHLRIRSFAGLPLVLLSPILWADSAPAADIAWRSDVSVAVQEAAREKKPMLIMISARWCGYCQKMLRQTFPNPAIAERVNRTFIPILIDADGEQELVERLKIGSMPTLLVVAPDRRILGSLAGFRSAAQLAPALEALERKAVKYAAESDRPAISPSAGKPRGTSRPPPGSRPHAPARSGNR